MKKFFAVVSAAIISLSFIATASATKLPLYDGFVETLHGLITIKAKYDYNERIRTGHYYSFTNDKNHKYYILHYGETDSEAGKDGKDYYGFRVNNDNTVSYAYLTISNVNVSDTKERNRRLHNAHLAFNILCEAMGMSSSDIDGLWSQLAVYAVQTNYSFNAEPKIFYQRCTSIHRDVEFTFKTINGKSIRLILDVVQP